MSQKKSKMINKFLVITGGDKTGTSFNTANQIDSSGNLVNKLHLLKESRRIKRDYQESNYKRKTIISSVMLGVINKK